MNRMEKIKYNLLVIIALQYYKHKYKHITLATEIKCRGHCKIHNNTEF
jgi:hypothetical protein